MTAVDGYDYDYCNQKIYDYWLHYDYSKNL